MTVRNSDALATTDQMGFVAQDRQIKAAFDKGRILEPERRSLRSPHMCESKVLHGEGGYGL